MKFMFMRDSQKFEKSAPCFIPDAIVCESPIIRGADSGKPMPGSGDAFRTVSVLGSGDVLDTPSTVTDACDFVLELQLTLTVIMTG